MRRKSANEIRMTNMTTQELHEFDNRRVTIDPKVHGSGKRVKRSLDYTSIVLSGGGAKGVAHVGLLLHLESIGVLQNITNIAGTSAGALIGFLLAIGYNAQEIKREVMSLQFKKFTDGDNIITDMYHLLHDYGEHHGSYVSSYVQSHIMRRLSKGDCTFKELYKLMGVNFVVTGTNVTKGCTEVFSRATTPNMQVATAVRISMSVPYLFAPVHYNGSIYVDGGLADNYPLDIFDYPTPDGSVTPTNDANMRHVNNSVIGSMLVPQASSNACDSRASNVSSRNDCSSLVNYSTSIVDTMMGCNIQRHLDPYWKYRTIMIPVPPIPLTKLDINSSEKLILIKEGRKAAEKFFDQ